MQNKMVLLVSNIEILLKLSDFLTLFKSLPTSLIAEYREAVDVDKVIKRRILVQSWKRQIATLPQCAYFRSFAIKQSHG